MHQGLSLGKKVPGSLPKGSADMPVAGGDHRRMQESCMGVIFLTSSICLVPCSLLFQLTWGFFGFVAGLFFFFPLGIKRI